MIMRKKVIMLSISRIRQTESKLARLAEKLDSSLDFVDYWYSFMKSKTKERIDDWDDNINSFWINRWKANFEKYEDKYIPKEGNGHEDWEREAVASVTQNMVYAFQITSKEIIDFYGKGLIICIIKNADRFDHYGPRGVLRDVVTELGLPQGVVPDYSFRYED